METKESKNSHLNLYYTIATLIIILITIICSFIYSENITIEEKRSAEISYYNDSQDILKLITDNNRGIFYNMLFKQIINNNPFSILKEYKILKENQNLSKLYIQHNPNLFLERGEIYSELNYQYQSKTVKLDFSLLKSFIRNNEIMNEYRLLGPLNDQNLFNLIDNPLILILFLYILFKALSNVFKKKYNKQFIILLVFIFIFQLFIKKENDNLKTMIFEELKMDINKGL